MKSEHQEFSVIHRFFNEEHRITKKQEGEERIKFLKPPAWHGGGRVPAKALYREDNIVLLKIDMIPALDILSVALGSVNTLAKTKYDKNVGIRLIPKILHACERRGIPQNFCPGILLLYTEHCEGCPWRHLVPKILAQKQAALDKFERQWKQGNDEAKLSPSDWPAYMIESVAEFVKVSRRVR